MEFHSIPLGRFKSAASAEEKTDHCQREHDQYENTGSHVTIALFARKGGAERAAPLAFKRIS